MAFGDANDPFLIKQNDTRPQLDYTIQQGPVGGKVSVDMTNATSVVFNMRLKDTPGTVVINRGSAEFVAPLTSGVVRYTFSEADTADADDYIGEFEVTFDDDGVLTAPTGNSWIYIQIGDDIG